MQSVTKPYIYKLLNQIRAEKQLDVADLVAKVVSSNQIPYEAVVFINKYIPIEQLTTYNAIYDKRNRSRLFRNIVKDDLSTADKAIVLSSILNQCLISIKKENIVDRANLMAAVNIEIILNALNSYMFAETDEEVNDCFEMFRTIFKTLYPR